MQVYLLTAKDVIEVMERNAVHGALTCTGNEYRLAGETYEYKQFLSDIIAKGHESVLEHINLTFRVDGISRALLQELSRHRHISLSVRSTRSTLKKMASSPERIHNFYSDLERILVDACCSAPETVEGTDRNRTDVALLEDAMEHAVSAVRSLLCMDPGSPVFVSDYLKYFLPEFVPTSLVMTVNLRELRHIFKLRSQPAALLEFRRLVLALYEAIPEEHHYLFDDVLHDGVFSLPEASEDDDDGFSEE